MTERTGGSDVGLAETVARRDASGAFRLYGTKWFTSATSADGAHARASGGRRPRRQRARAVLPRVRDADGRLNASPSTG